MSGLPDRALSTRTKPPQTSRGQEASDIPAEERRELLAEIEKVVARARVPLGARQFTFTAGGRELLLPVLVNAGAILVISAAAFLLPIFLEGGGQARGGGAGSRLAGESALVGTLKKESEQAVLKAQASLQAALKERDELATGADSIIRRRQAELSASLNAELAAERERLRNEGASNVAIERQLRTLEQERRAALERQLSEFQGQVAAQVAQKDAEIRALRAQTTQSRQEQERMAALETTSRSEQIVLDQLNASYAGVGDAMKAGRWADARTGLDALRSYLEQPAVAAVPAVQKRRMVDLFLIDSLRKLTETQGAVAESTGPRSSSAIGQDQRATEAVREATEAVAAGNSLYAAGNYRGALERWGVALQALKERAPGVETLASRIADAGFRQRMADLTSAQDQAARATFDRAQDFAARGAYPEAVAAYVSLIRAYPESAYARKALAGVQAAADALSRKAAEQASAAGRADQLASLGQKQQEMNAAARQKLKTLGDSVREASRRSAASAAAAQDELIALLQVKVDVRQVLLSDAVRAEHPDLAEKLDRFLDLTTDVRREEGRAAAMRDAAAVIDSMVGRSGASDLSSVVKQYSDETLHPAFQRFLDALRGLFP